MSTGRETTDELLAKWSELPRHNEAIRHAGRAEFTMRYGLFVEDFSEYGPQTDVTNDLHRFFLKDAMLRLREIEEALRQRGVTVKRPDMDNRI